MKGVSPRNLNGIQGGAGERGGVRGYYFRIVADYIHLNPARAGLAGGDRGKLVAYRWSSLPLYAKGKGPDWLVLDRVLRAFELAEDGRGRRAYVAWLEARAREDGGKISEEAEAALRKGWYLGEESFKDKLLAMIDGAGGRKSPRSSKAGVSRDHGEVEATRIIREMGKVLELPTKEAELMKIRKGDERKVLLAALMRRRTSVGLNWIAERLAMGHPGAVSRLVVGIGKDKQVKMRLDEMEILLNCERTPPAGLIKSESKLACHTPPLSAISNMAKGV